VLNQCPGLDPKLVGDVIVGCAMPEASRHERGPHRPAAAGLPDSVPGMTSTGSALPVQAVAQAADRIGW